MIRFASAFVLAALTASVTTAAPPDARGPTPDLKAARNPDPYGYPDYSSFKAYIESNPGARGVLTVGPYDPYVGSYIQHCRVDSGFGGLADGAYDCYQLQPGGIAVLQPKVPILPMTGPPGSASVTSATARTGPTATAASSCSTSSLSVGACSASASASSCSSATRRHGLFGLRSRGCR